MQTRLKCCANIVGCGIVYKLFILLLMITAKFMDLIEESRTSVSLDEWDSLSEVMQ